MKLPWILRSRHLATVRELEAKLAQTRQRVAELGGKVEALSESRTRYREQLAELTRRNEALEAAAKQRRMALLDRVTVARSGRYKSLLTPIPVVLGVDVEPDDRSVDLADPSWRGTEAFLRRWPELESRLVAASGAGRIPLTWFPRADPQVAKCHGDASFALRHFARHWEAALQAGDEMGLHMHPWRWDDTRPGWVQDHADAAWMEHCLRSSIASYRAHFGSSPPVYRGGDHYLDSALVRVLEEEGIPLDMTLELLPARDRLVVEEHGTGTLPDCSRVPASAYRPSAADFRVPDPQRTTGLGMLPLTPWRGGSLLLWQPNDLVDEALEGIVHAEARPSHLAFVVRSNIAATGYWDAFEENALSLARRVREGSLRFVTATQAWELAASVSRSS